jgi:hypothetical protein
VPNIFVSSVQIIFKRIYKQWDGRAWTGLIWLRIGTGGGLSGSDNLGFHKMREFLD